MDKPLFPPCYELSQQYRTHHSEKNIHDFSFSKFDIFRREMTSQSWRQILLFSIIGYRMTASERACDMDLKTDKINEICLSTQKIQRFKL